MKTRKMCGLSRIGIFPLTEGKQFQFRLEFPGGTPPEAIEFELSPDHLMALLMALKKLQARHKIPIPEGLRPQGRPALTVVVQDPED